VEPQRVVDDRGITRIYATRSMASPLLSVAAMHPRLDSRKSRPSLRMAATALATTLMLCGTASATESGAVSRHVFGQNGVQRRFKKVVAEAALREIGRWAQVGPARPGEMRGRLDSLPVDVSMSLRQGEYVGSVTVHGVPAVFQGNNFTPWSGERA